MKNTTNIFNNEIASRFAKKFKKHLNQIGHAVSLNQCQEVLAQSVGFPTFHAAQKADFQIKSKKHYHLLTFNLDINDGELIFQKNKYVFLFENYDQPHFNFHQLIQFVDFGLDTNQIDFSPERQHFFDSVLKEAMLKVSEQFSYSKTSMKYIEDLSVYSLFHELLENKNTLIINLFKNENVIRLFDEFFKELFFTENKMDFFIEHIKYIYSHFELKTLDENQKDTLLELNCLDCIISK